MLLHDKLASRHLILASQSPRRRELLAGAGLDFTLAPRYECDEVYPSSLAAVEVPAYLSQLKSRSYPFDLEERDILLTADTVVVAGGRVLGKPHTVAEAQEMLRLLSGATHTVVSGITLRSTSHSETFSSSSEVTFRVLTDEEIDHYIDRYRPFDKAGSYGIQEWIGYVAIEGIRGSFYNVMGLPIQRLYTELDKFLSL